MTAQRERLPVSRGIGLVCVAAAAGALITGCAKGGTSATGTTAVEAAQVAPTTSSPSAPAISPSAPATSSSSPASSTSASASGGTLTEDQAQRKALLAKVKVGYDKALSAATAAVPKSKPVGIELKGPADSPGWEAAVATADGTVHHLRVDAVTGKAAQGQVEQGQDSDDKRELADRLSKATVTVQQAVQTATGNTKGTVTAVELGDTDSGAPKWSVDVVTAQDWNKTTFDIDGTNRKIIRLHVDQD
ncbi:PepSY domain-containing protein [Streptomyces sp. NPDC048514]|uniref:PepSY domain-containing protein n=1 Tax=Streptomyces sp. NPDC048514 TaxID=3365564 RepID=UPI00371DA13C